jgi:heat-inducible transcriptional repressor
MTEIPLDRRAQEILGAVVEQYVQSGEPVGSRTLAQRNPERLSPATIRNTMADLEQLGLLEQPHTSAGRVPTELGYRVYVNNLMHDRPIGRSEEKLIQESLGHPGADASQLFAQVSRVLSQISHQIGVVITPNISRVRLKHLEFVRLAPRRCVAIIVAESGVIHNKVFETEEDYAQDQLDGAGRFLTETFQGMTLPETRERILAMLTEEKALYDRMLHDALTLGSASVEGTVAVAGLADSHHVFLDGASNLIDKPEFADAERLKAIFRAFEQKHDILRILNRCIEEAQPGVRVLIGSETDLPDLNQCTLITSTYGPEGAPLGALGVLGPTRMEYAKAVALVDYVSRFFGSLLKPYNF